MQQRDLPALPIAPLMPDTIGAALSAEVCNPGTRGWQPYLWLDARTSRTAAIVRAGGLWAEFWLGELVWVRFEFSHLAFSRAVFRAAEVRLVRDPEQPRPDGEWLPPVPPHRRAAASA